MEQQVVIFTDLDGTLLDHEHYSYAPALPCLEYIRENTIPLIFASSKTAIEIQHLCGRMQFFHPFIAENGGLLGIPKDYFSESAHTEDYTRVIIGASREKINRILDKFKHRYLFKRFQEMNVAELIHHTGLSKEEAMNANQRDSTEPLLWLDDASKLNDFRELLTQHGLTLTRGGRFYHVMGQHDKATTMQLLIEKYRQHCGKNVISIALGDSQNDLQMLRSADHSILIPNAYALCNANHAMLRHAPYPGPHGWSTSLLPLLKELLE